MTRFSLPHRILPALHGAAAVIALAAALLCEGRASGQSIVGWGATGFSNIDDLSGVARIACGGGDNRAHVAVVRGDGIVACWGGNDFGQCNVPAGLGAIVDLAAGGSHTVALESGGTVVCWGANGDGQCAVPAGLGKAIGVAAGLRHTVALRSDGTVVCWGLNSDGQCNVPKGLGPITRVAAGRYHTVALRADGTVLCWGANYYGQCNVPAGLGQVTDIAAGADHAVARRVDGTVICWGDNLYGQCNVPDGLGEVAKIAAGRDHCVALRTDGSVVCWGSNGAGQCNVPTNLGQIVLIAAGDFYTAAVKADGSVVFWGQAPLDRPPPANLGRVAAADMARGFGLAHYAALRFDGTVACWGDNDYGQCDVPAGLNQITAIAAGGFHNAVLKADGRVECWGRNESGQCDVPVGLATVTRIAAGLAHTVALRTDGTPVCWGNNQYGQCAPPPEAANLFAIAAGDDHNAGLRLGGTVVCWGRNDVGQCNVPVGLTNVVAIRAGRIATAAIRSDGTVAFWGNVFPPAEPLNDAVDVALGDVVVAVLRSDGTVLMNYGVPPEVAQVGQLAGGRSGIGDSFLALRCPAIEVVELQSAELGALGSGSPRQHTFAGLVPPSGDATITVRVRGDFGASNEFATLELDGGLWTVLFQAGASDCPASPDVAVVSVPAKQFAALAGDGSLTVRLQASPDASATQCPNASTVIELAYAASPNDCNANGFDDACEVQFALNDCNGNGRPDGCDIADGISEDADADGKPDECAADCNGNGTPDVLEIAAGSLEDCDENGVADLCEKRTSVALDAQFSPIGYGFAARWEIEDAVPAVEPVTLACRARGDFGATLEYVRLACGSLFTADAFVDNFDCPPFPTSAETFVLTPEQFNDGIGADGVWRLDALPTIAVDAMLCDGGTLLVLELSYVGASPADCNGNSLLDTCEIANGWAPDVNGNGIPDGCETLFDACPTDLNGDGLTSATDLAVLLSAWGDAKGPADVDGNGSVDALDLAAILNGWGPCPEK